jgi:hypothetical protein
MDVGAFVQENKRWLIGCGIGVAVFFIGSAVIGSIWNPAPIRARAKATATQTGDGFYDQAALRAAQEEGAKLHAERERLQAELAFVPDPAYVLANQSMSPDVYLGKVGRELKQRVMQQANRLEIAVLDKDLTWPQASGEEIRGVLVGLAIMDECAKRLLAAHNDVRAADPDAMGLRAISSLRLEERRGNRQVLRQPKPGEVDLRDLLTQERLTFQFQSDTATALRFFELCRQPGKCLVLEPFTMTPPTKPGEPVTVKGSLIGIAFLGEKAGQGEKETK